MSQSFVEEAVTPTARLRSFNLKLGVLHFAQGVLVLALSSDFSLPMTSSFLGFDSAFRTLVPIHETIGRIQIAPLVAAFFFISAIAHLAVSTTSFEWYERQLENEINPARWIEYSLSSSLMIVVIAMLVGVYDIASVISLFGLNAAMILFGWVMELQDRSKKVAWLPYRLGILIGTVPWLVIAIYLFGSSTHGSAPPTFVYYIYLSIFLSFSAFAVVMFKQYRGKGKWADYLYGEKAYIWLSLLAKTALAWQVFVGTLRPV